MSARLIDHVNHIAKFDGAVRTLGGQRWHSLKRAERRCEALGGDGGGCRRTHADAGECLRRRSSIVAERDFALQPAVADWIAESRDRDLVCARYLAACLELAGFVRTLPIRGVWWYGNVKTEEAVRGKVTAFEEGRSDLDLWDVRRFRIVAPGFAELLTVTLGLLARFQVIRVRNYYSRPRKGPRDPYRAIHVEIWTTAAGLVEIQVLTALREAVGQIDHTAVHKKIVPFLNETHERWLFDLSWTANVMDWERAMAGNMVP